MKPFRWLAAAVFAAFAAQAQATEPAVSLPPPARDTTAAEASSEIAVLAGGCFWGVQGVFQHVKGVTRVLSGYAGGTKQTARYDSVSSGRTGHAESVEITFDPREISYGTILQIFFSVAHTPTQLNYQGPDHGSQYRSAIFYGSAEQKAVADAYIAQLGQAKAFPAPIVTEVAPLKTFYRAEDYHQDYLTLHPRQPYIVAHDLPKLEHLKSLFPALYREKPVLVSRIEMN